MGEWELERRAELEREGLEELEATEKASTALLESCLAGDKGGGWSGDGGGHTYGR